MIGLGLSIPQVAVRGTGGVTQAQIAAIGVDALYTPRDLTSMYTTINGGTNPMAGEIARVVLDKSEMGGLTTAAFISGQPNIAPVAVTYANFDGSNGFQSNGTYENLNETSANGSYPRFGHTGYDPTKTYHYRCVVTGGDVERATGFGGGNSSVRNNFNNGVCEGIVSGASSLILATDGRDVFSFDMTLEIRELPGNHLRAPSDAESAFLQQDGGDYYLEADGVDDWYAPMGGAIDLDEQWYGIGAWQASSSALFATSDIDQGAAIVSGGKIKWPDVSDVLQTLIDVDPSSPFVATIEQTATNLIAGRANGGGGGTAFVPYDDSAAVQGLSLFSQKNDAWTNGFDGRFYGGMWSAGTISAEDRALAELYFAQRAGVVLSL